MAEEKNKKKEEKDPKVQLNNKFALLSLVFLIGIFALIISFMSKGTQREITYSSFFKLLDSGRIGRVHIIDSQNIRAQGAGSESGVTYITKIPYPDGELLGKLRKSGVEIVGNRKSAAGIFFMQFIPWIIILVFMWVIYRSMQGGSSKAFSFGKSRAKRYDPNLKDKITFKNVAGAKESKYELMEVVDFLKNPEKFTKIGAKIPKGILLVGQPGTGKTLLAKAVAGEAEVAFFHMSGSDFMEMFVGVGASRVRDLFAQGIRNKPCIIFIDEIDAVGRVRGAGYGGGHDEREQTLNQLLVEMDGFDGKQGIVIMAATNRPDVLDPALLRPGRFDRQVTIDMPDENEREAILKIHCEAIQLSEDINMQKIARATPGASGADLANIVNEAALFAARNNHEKVTDTDFEEARDKVFMGVARKSKILSPEEKEKTAYHEAGHALLHYYLENTDPLHKVTVIPRGRALGVTFSLPEKDIFNRSMSWLLARIRICYGGYVAEEIIYGEVSVGSSNDIEQATQMARRMVCEWGMSEKIGPMGLSGENPIFIGKEITQHKDYADHTARVIDEEIQRILREALEDVRRILREHKDELEALTKALIEKETLDDAQVRELLKTPRNEEEPVEA